jgi:hypothetical protein
MNENTNNEAPAEVTEEIVTVTPCDLVCDICGRTTYWCHGHRG